MKKVVVNNYYDNTDVSIPLDETLPIMDNANRYFAKYNKLKRTRDALDTQIKETESSIEHLGLIMASIQLAESESDLMPLKQELFDYGYTKKRPGTSGKGGREKKQKPLHFVTEDGYEIISEAYLRDKDGNIVKDPETNSARRIDFVVVKDGKVVDSVEVTSKTASKEEQSAKEDRNW